MTISDDFSDITWIQVPRADHDSYWTFNEVMNWVGILKYYDSVRDTT